MNCFAIKMIDILLRCTLLLLLISVFTITESSSFDSSIKRIVCYFSKENENRESDYKLFPEEIDADLCTHILYATDLPDIISNNIPDGLIRNEKSENILKSLVKLKFLNPKLKLLLSIGAKNEDSKIYSQIISNPVSRGEFIQNIISYIRLIEFDGVDINWQWPTMKERGTTLDKTRFSDFIKELKNYIITEAKNTNKDALILSLVLPQFKVLLERGFEIDTISDNVDMMNLWTMDYSSSTDRLINHNAPLYCYPSGDCDQEYNVDNSIKQYFSLGLEPEKMNLGIPTYGYSYILEDMFNTQYRSLADDEGRNGDGLKEPGKLAYFEICKYIKNSRWSYAAPNISAVGPYAYRGLDWVAFDDTLMIKRKVEYANRKCIGGVMFWSIDMDDFKGLCFEKFELINSAKEALISTYNKTAPCEGFGNNNPELYITTMRPKKKFKIIKRERWNAAKATEEIKKLRISPVPYVIIAHTVSNPCQDFETCREIIRNIQSFQIAMDYGDIGFHFLVGGDGNAYEGLGWDLHGAHTLPFNARSISIAFIGDYSVTAPNEKQINATINIINEGVRIGKIRPDYKIFGQRQVINTASPGNALMKEIKKFHHYSIYDPVEDDEE